MDNKLISNIEIIRSLVKELNEASYAYYAKDNPIMTDKEWDEKFDLLSKLEKKENFIMSNSPTQNVGTKVISGLKKAKHSHPMLSLNKTKDIDDLIEFSKKNPCILTCKMDGLTVLLTYENGKLSRAETRGDGLIGENIIHNARVFSNIPLTIPNKHKVEIEGEAIITYKDFNRINESNSDDELYRNPRNLVSGSVRQLDSQIAKNRNIKFVAWKIPFGFVNMIDGLHYAEDLGFEVVPYIYNPLNIDDAINYLKDCASNMSYPIDGLVMTYNNMEYGKSLGETGHHPKHSIAFKFYDEEYETMLKTIDWTIGKTGVLTPTAVFNSVMIDGTKVERASLHNVSVLKHILGDKPFIGQKIKVAKMNMIIPQVMAAEKNENVDKDLIINIPNKCPICGGEVSIKKDNDSEILCCNNKNCSGKALQKLKFFVSKEAINIDGLSESTLKRLIDIGVISKYKDIFYLKDHKKQLVNLDGFGMQSVNNLLNNIEHSRFITLSNFINSLNIDYIGARNSKAIEKTVIEKLSSSEQYNGVWEVMKDMIIDNYNWCQIVGIGSKMSLSIKKFFEENFDDINELAEEFHFISEESNVSNDFEGLQFVVTGSLNRFESRNQLKEFIESRGGKVVSTISSKTKYLINNNIYSKSKKNVQAKELNIPIITEDELFEMIEA